MSAIIRNQKGIIVVFVVLVLAGLAAQDISLGNKGNDMDKTKEKIISASSSSRNTERATFALG